MTRRLLLYIIAALGLEWGATALRLLSAREELAATVAAHQRASIEALRRAADQTQALNEAHAQAIKAANIRAQNHHTAAVRAGTELDRLRRTIAARRDDSVPRDPACPAADPAPAEGELLGQCGDALVELARAADGHARDAITCNAAWPVLEVAQ